MFSLLLCLSNCEQFHSLRTYRTSVFPLSLYRNESSIGERTLYKTLLLIRILRKTVRQEQIQDTKSTRNRTSVFTTKLNERVHESKQCIPSLFTYIELKVPSGSFFGKIGCLPFTKKFRKFRLGCHGMVRPFWFARTEIFQNERNVSRGSPKFPNGVSERKMCLPFAIRNQFQAIRQFFLSPSREMRQHGCCCCCCCCCVFFQNDFLWGLHL